MPAVNWSDIEGNVLGSVKTGIQLVCVEAVHDVLKCRYWACGDTNDGNSDLNLTMYVIT